MKTFNDEANMKMPNHFSAGTLSMKLAGPDCRSARRRGSVALPTSWSQCWREDYVRLKRLIRHVTIVLSFLLCLSWLASPVTGFALPNYTNATEVASYVRQMLYWPDAAASTNFNAQDAAFRYKVLLYTNDGTILPNPANIDNLYTDTEHERAREAETNLLAGLAIHPDSIVLRDLLLDIYYDRTVAESIYAGNAEEKAEQAHFGPPIADPAPPGGFIIDNEIADYAAALQSNRVALATYCALLTNSLGMPKDVDGTPLGYRIFEEEVPGRGLDPATYLSNGVPVCVIANTNALFTGYKDLVLLYQLLSDQGRTAATLAHLYFLRHGPGDTNAAQATITEAQRSLFLHAELLRTAFPNLNLNDPALANSGVGTALAGVSDSLAQLDQVKTAQRSGLNPLGFDPDFLVLLDDSFSGEGTYPDTYDALMMHLGTANSALGLATNVLGAARASYATYRGGQDQLAFESARTTISYEDQLHQIVGVYPSDPLYASYPMGAPGSQLNEQFLEVSNAVLDLTNITTQMNDVYEKVDIELKRVGAVTNAYIRYGNERASVQEVMGGIKGTMAAANALAEGASSAVESFGSSMAAQAANAVIQAGGEVALGVEEGKLENMEAQQSATVEGINSSAQVQTWLLDLNTLEVDLQSARVKLQQQVNLLVALQRQKADLERKLAACDTSLTGRYFADPVHRLAMQADMVKADAQFQQAQEWLFFMARALEYKWNETLSSLSSDEGYQGWTMATLFKLRNADELEDMYNAMKNFDDLQVLSSSSDDRFDWFSVRDQLLGYPLTNDLGQVLSYVDPVTGQTNDAIGAFRLYLTRHINTNENPNYLELDLNTVRSVPSGTFFSGPVYYSNGTVDPTKPGCYLDKIRWMMIRLPGGFGQDAEVSGYLRYGGTSYIRNKKYGTRDPQRPDRIIGEMTPYSTRRWQNVSGRWVFTDGLNAQISMMMAPRDEKRLNGSTDNPYVLPSVNEIDVFKERSVATTKWHLAIPVTGPGSVAISNLDDIQIYFYHWSFNR